MIAERPRDPVLDLEAVVKETMAEFYHVVAATGRAPEFIAAMKRRAEIVVRMLPRTPPENRDMAMGQISICYELADGAKSALDAEPSLAKEDEADRIRREIAAMK